MAETNVIIARPRDVIGKASRRLAAEGLIPAVLYGPGREAQAISVDRHDFEMLLAHGSGGSQIVKLEVEGDAKPVDAIVKEMQTAAVKGTVQHIDFMVIRMDQTIHATVPIRYEGEDVSVGVRAGGVLMHNLREINVEALPGDLPESIVADVSAIEVNQNLHISDLEVPDGVVVLDDVETIVCSIAPPKIEVEEEVVLEEEEAEEPEVIGEEKAEAEEA